MRLAHSVINDRAIRRHMIMRLDTVQLCYNILQGFSGAYLHAAMGYLLIVYAMPCLKKHVDPCSL